MLPDAIILSFGCGSLYMEAKRESRFVMEAPLRPKKGRWIEPFLRNRSRGKRNPHVPISHRLFLPQVLCGS